jgi:hypothetical protein
LLLGGQRIVVVGQPGSGIDVGGVIEGRMARVTGIVRRPYPTASDQRFAITPRDRTDLRILGAAPSSSSDSGSGSGTTNPQGRGGGEFGATPGAAAAPVGTVDADLVDLAVFAGQTVRVGGLVVDLRPTGLLLDDGTLVGQVVLRGAALELLPLLEPDDAINAIGRVELHPDGPVVVVDDPGGIIQAGEPVAVTAPSGPNGASAGSGSAISPDASPSTRLAGLADTTGTPWAGLAGIGTLVALSLASLAFTLGRRAHAQRRIAARIAARVDAFGATGGPPNSPRPVDHDRSTLS